MSASRFAPFYFAADESPERGWEPFMLWMYENGMDPSRTYSVALGEGVVRCVEWVENADGWRTEQVERVYPVSSLPPLHPLRSGAS